MRDRTMKRTLLALISGVFLALAGCGGTGAGAGGQADASLTATAAALITLGVSSPTIASDGLSTVDVVATVKNASNVALAGQPVAFSTADTGAVLSVTASTTDATGTATAKLAITDPTSRAIVVKATSGTISGTVSVLVTGSSLTLSGATSISFGGNSTYIAALKNSAGTPVGNTPVVLESKSGNAIVPLVSGSNVTDSAGQAKFAVTGSVAGVDTLTAKAQGISQSRDVSVSGNVAVIEAPLANAELLVNTVQTVRAKFMQGGAPLTAGSVIQFSATRGTLSSNSATTGSDGVASATIQSASAGVTSINATAPDGTSAAVEFEFVSRTPSSVWLQASPTTIAVNAPGASASTSELLARVKDASNNPVKGVRVDFSADSDPSGGRISPPYALTDSAGIASSSFIAGPNSSGYNLVQVRARVPSTGTAHTANLTVAAQALSVRIHTGNTLESPDPQTYLLPYAAVVSDAAGNPVEGAAVAVSYVPTYFYKGTYVGGASGWSANRVQRCASEDVNGNGILDAGEDANGNVELDPGNVATAYVTTAGGKTDSSGFASLAIKYPRGYASWVEVLLQVTITATSGTETITSTPILLPALAGDLSSTDTSPPGGVNSRFGTSAGCDNTN